MSKLFAKLQHKGQVVYLLNAPDSIEPFLAELEGVEIRRSCAKKERIDFSLSFAITQAELDKLSRLVIAAASYDATLWFAYPKGSSQRYQCEFNRDSGWTVLRGGLRTGADGGDRSGLVGPALSQSGQDPLLPA